MGDNKQASVTRELKGCADQIEKLDKKMQNLYNISVSLEKNIQGKTAVNS